MVSSALCLAFLTVIWVVEARKVKIQCPAFITGMGNVAFNDFQSCQTLN